MDAKTELKNQLINSTAITGSRTLAMDQAEITYLEFKSLMDEDMAFKKAIKEAETFYTSGINRVMAALGKQRLYELLVNGEKETIRKTTSLYNDEGELLTKTEITVKEKGVPVSAIKLAIECLPELVRVAEQLVSHDALEVDRVEAVEAGLEGVEDVIRKALAGSVESNSLTDQILATAQNILLNG